jgi:hypothetical protein
MADDAGRQSTINGLPVGAQEAVVALLRDLEASLAPEALLELEAATIARVGELLDFVDQIDIAQALVNDVQQQIHDEFIDVSWPRCPRHPNHPLWLVDRHWQCTRDKVTVAALGELSTAWQTSGDGSSRS